VSFPTFLSRETGGSRGFGYHERLLTANGGSDKDKSGSGAERLPSACLGPATGRSCEERAHPKLSIAYRLIQLERASAARVLGVFDPGTLFVGRGGFPLVFVGRTMWYPEELPGPRLRESQMNAGGRHPVSERLGVIWQQRAPVVCCCWRQRLRLLPCLHTVAVSANALCCLRNCVVGGLPSAGKSTRNLTHQQYLDEDGQEPRETRFCKVCEVPRSEQSQESSAETE
jgi:hypothetical protein